jgi:hypothetical protein
VIFPAFPEVDIISSPLIFGRKTPEFGHPLLVVAGVGEGKGVVLGGEGVGLGVGVASAADSAAGATASLGTRNGAVPSPLLTRMPASFVERTETTAPDASFMLPICMPPEMIGIEVDCNK